MFSAPSFGTIWEVSARVDPSNEPLRGGRNVRAVIEAVAEVVQEHIDLMIRPSSGTTKTYQIL